MYRNQQDITNQLFNNEVQFNMRKPDVIKGPTVEPLNLGVHQGGISSMQ